MALVQQSKISSKIDRFTCGKTCVRLEVCSKTCSEKQTRHPLERIMLDGRDPYRAYSLRDMICVENSGLSAFHLTLSNKA